MSLLRILSLIGFIIFVTGASPRAPREASPLDPVHTCLLRGDNHCGCAAQSCGLPCSTCCAPGTCSMTIDPSGRVTR